MTENENSKIYFQTEDIIIYNDNFITTDLIEKNSVDLIVTSPPYNLGIEYNSFDDKTAYEDYLKFTEQWLSKSFKVLKNTGRLCLNIPLDKNKFGHQTLYIDVVSRAKKIGYKYRFTIIWNKSNIAKRTAWGSWLSPSAPNIVAPIEVIVVLYKNEWKKSSKNKKTDITKEEFISWTNGLWSFSGETRKDIKHPAPFPLELPKRCIKMLSFIGDVVLDPFLGSGSTLIACSLLKRKGIGIEIDKKYCKEAKNRLIEESFVAQKPLF